MSDTCPATSETGPAYPSTEDISAWAGWIVCAGVMLVLVGFFHIVEGLDRPLNASTAMLFWTTQLLLTATWQVTA
jgi:hypothetical protein